MISDILGHPVCTIKLISNDSKYDNIRIGTGNKRLQSISKESPQQKYVHKSCAT